MQVSFMILCPFVSEGKTTFPAKFGQVLDIPDSLVRSDVRIGASIQDELHWFQNPHVGWSKKTGCIIEVRWPTPNDQEFLNRIRTDTTWAEGSPVQS